MRTRERISSLRDDLIRAAQARGALDLRLFGSVARGDDTAHSDIDFLVSLAPGRTLLDLASLQLELERILGRPVDVITEQGLPESVRSTVLTEAIHV